MNLGSTLKALGCLLAPLWIALAIPLILAYFAFKVLVYLINEAATSESGQRNATSAHRLRRKPSSTTAHRFGFLRTKRSEPLVRQMKRHAERLFSEISEALKHNQRIPPEKKTALDKQTRQMTDYAMSSLQKIEQIHRRQAMVNETRRLELARLERRLTAEVERALSMLEDALVSIITVDVAGGNSRIDRLVNDLSESNSRLRDTADAHDEIRSVRETWAGELR
jgi:hypothetical protein